LSGEEYYMDMITIELRKEDAAVLNELLDIEEETFKDARAQESEEPHSSWEDLLSLTGSYTETLLVIERLKESIEDGRPA
jgi:hypothetical protein